MKSILLILAALAAIGLAIPSKGSEAPPMPPGMVTPLLTPRALANPQSKQMAAAVALPNQPQGIFLINVIPGAVSSYQTVECYVSTNRPSRWEILGSEDLVHWKVWSGWYSNSYPTHLIPKLRDNARLVDWFMVPVKRAQYFKIRIL